MKRIIAALLTAVLLITAACGRDTSVQKEHFADITEHTAPMTNAALHTRQQDSKKLNKIAASGIVELYEDPVTFAVSVRETVSGQYWHSLPPYVKGHSDAAAPVTLTVRQGDKRYFWNVQENSVAFGKASSEKLADGTGLIVSYDCYPDAETARNPMPPLAFRIELRYTLEDGSLAVRASWENLSTSPGAVIESLGLMESFGSYDKSAPGDFLLLPDGSGAVVNTAKEDAAFAEPLCFRVYGSDKAYPTEENALRAIMPVYGIRRGNSGFAAYIEEGAAIASIIADRERGGGLNRAGARFDITPEYAEKKGGKTAVYSAAESYGGKVKADGEKAKIAIRYRFLSGGAAEYSGMAGALREQLISIKLIPSRAVENQEKLPVNITLTASAKIKKGMEQTKTLTTADQVQELLALLKGKGIDNAFLQYTGATSRGASLRVLRRAGGPAGYIALQEAVHAQNMQLFLDIPFISGNSGARAEGLRDTKIEISRLSEVSALCGAKTRQYSLRAVGSLDMPEGSRGTGVTEKILLSLRGIKPMGLSLNDLESALYTDCTPGAYYDRQEAADMIRTQLEALSTGRKLMVSGGDFYLLRSASVVTRLPSRAEAVEESEAYVSVPLAQMLLHGKADYSFAPLNLYETQEERERALLKAIEYGALPAFSWIASPPDTGDDGVDRLDYEDSLTFAADCARRSGEALADLRGSRITRHTVYQPGVSGTEYESGAIIYVNANGKAAKVNGLTVRAMDFLRVN